MMNGFSIQGMILLFTFIFFRFRVIGYKNGAVWHFIYVSFSCEPYYFNVSFIIRNNSFSGGVVFSCF
jgi:hypothetical protein